MRSRTSGGVAELVKTLVYAVVIAVFIRTFFYEPFNIPSASMVPTLLIGDYLFVSKFSYGYSRYSLPLGPPVFSGRLFSRPPQRGDVVVFKLPRDPSLDYIKRVIGLPGDHIQMKGGLLYINGIVVKREPTEGCDVPPDAMGSTVPQRYWETLPNGVGHCIIELGDDRMLDNTPVFSVPTDTYFMMGDNRDNSSDSRDPNSGVGYVPAENLVGRAEFIFFSTNGYASWWELWKWPFTIRYGRLLTAIH
jgi:signal peptidase I